MSALQNAGKTDDIKFLVNYGSDDRVVHHDRVIKLCELTWRKINGELAFRTNYIYIYDDMKRKTFKMYIFNISYTF